MTRGRAVALLGVAYAVTRLPFVNALPNYFDSPEFVWRVPTLQGVFAGGHYPHQANFLWVAHVLSALLEPALALNVASLVFGLFSILAFFVLCLQFAPLWAALTGSLLVLGTPFVALCDLAGYSVGFNTCFYFLTLYFTVLFLRTGRAWHLWAGAASWFVGVGGHLMMGMWTLAVPAVWLMAGVPRADLLKRGGVATAACALATVLSLGIQGMFVGLQHDVGVWDGVLLLLTRNGTGPQPWSIKLLVTAARMVQMQVGTVVLVGAAAVLFMAPPARAWLVLPLMVTGLLVSTKLFHWGLVGRPAVLGVMLLWFVMVTALQRLSPRAAVVFVGVAFLQEVLSFQHVMLAGHARHQPLVELQAAGAALARQEPAAWLVTSERVRTFSGFPEAHTIRYESPDDNAALEARVRDAWQRGERVFVDSHALYHPRRKLDGRFYTFDSVFWGMEPAGGLRSYLGPVVGAAHVQPLLLLDGEQFFMELRPDPVPAHLKEQCRTTADLVVVEARGVAPGAWVDVFSAAQPLLHLRVDRNDLLLQGLAALGLARDVVAWGYADASGTAHVVVPAAVTREMTVVSANGPVREVLVRSCRAETRSGPHS